MLYHPFPVFTQSEIPILGCPSRDYHGSIEARVPLLVWALMGDLILSLHGEEEPERDALGDDEEIGGQGSKIV